jgi:NitT/TauT family transport system substrate-binding protein
MIGRLSWPGWRISRVIPLVAATSVLAAAATASAGATHGVAPGKIHHAAADVPELTLGVPVTDPTFAYPYIAQVEGFFDKAGVKVNFINATGTLNSIGLLTSGRDDVMLQGPSNALVPSAQGKPANVIYVLNGGGITVPFAVLNKSSYKKPADLSGKTIGTIGATGSALAMANIASAAVKKAAGAGFNVKVFGDVATLNGALQSGQIDGAMGVEGWFDAGLQNGSYRLILDPRKLSDRNLFLKGFYPESSIIGMKDNLQNKKDAVVRFLEGIAMANEWIHSHTPADTANALRQVSIFQALNPDALLSATTFQYNFLTPYEGYLSKQSWQAGFPLISNANLGLDLSKPELQYGAIVDMSYLTAALKAAKIPLTRPRTVQLGVSGRTFSGKVRAKDRYNFSCIGFVPVTVQVRKGKAWSKAVSVSSQVDGSFSGRLPASAKGTFRAVAPKAVVGGIRTCLAATSPPVK